MPRLTAAIALILLVVAALFYWQQAPTTRIGELPATRETGQAAEPALASSGDLAASTAANANRQAVDLDAAAPEYTVRGVVLGDASWPDLSTVRVLAYQGAAHDSNGLFAGGMTGNLGQSQQPAFLLTGDVLAETAVDAQGHFELHSQSQHLRLTIDHDLYVLAMPEIVHASSESHSADVVLNPLLGGMVRGRLLGERKADVSSVTLRLEANPLSVLRDVRSMMAAALSMARPAAVPNSEHTFVFRGVASGADLQLMARGGRATARVREPALQPGEVRDVIVPVTTAAMLTVQVVDEAGNAVADASVSTRPADQQGMNAMLQSQHQSTGPDGSCHFESLPAGRYQLDAIAAGRTGDTQTIELVSAATTAEAKLTLREGGVVTGVVQTIDGQPVADARVAHQPMTNIPMLGDLTEQLGPEYLSLVAKSGAATDAAGRFRLSGLADEGEFLVVGAHQDFSAGVARDVHMGDVDVVVTLQPLSSVQGLVVEDGSNQIIPQFTASILRTSFLVLKMPIAREAVASEQGLFHFEGISADSYTLQIEADGFGPLSKSIKVEKGVALDVGTIALQRAATIRGVVRDQEGQPVQNALVRKQMGAMADNPILSMMLGSNDRIHSDTDGNFTLTPVAPGRLQLLASAEGFASGTSERLTVEPGQFVTGVVIELGHGGTIRGRLLCGPNQQPADFLLIAQHQSTQNTTTADFEPDGTFVIQNLDPGGYQVQAMSQALMNSFQNVAPKPGESFNIGKMIRQMTDGVVSQRCTVRTGEVSEAELDVRDLTVGAQWLVRVEIGGKPQQQGLVEAVSLDTGTLRVAMLEAGTATFGRMQAGRHRLQVRSGLTMTPVGAPQDLDYPSGVQEHHSLLALPGGELAGRVVDADSLEPLRAAIVRLHHDGTAEQDDSIGICLSNSDGEFAFTGLADGTYSLTAAQPLGNHGANKASSQTGIRVSSGTTSEAIVLRSQPAAGASVLVTGNDGRAIAGATVLCVDAEGRPRSSLGLTATSQDGRAWFGGMANGPARVVGRAPGMAPGASALQELRANQATEFTLTLSTGAPTRLSVVDATGKRLRGVALSAKVDDGPWLPSMLLVQALTADGTLDLGRLGPGNWTFQATHPAIGTISHSRAIRGTSPVTIVISK